MQLHAFIEHHSRSDSMNARGVFIISETKEHFKKLHLFLIVDKSLRLDAIAL